MGIEEEFEEQYKNLGKGPYILRLFVAGISPRSQRAIKNLKKILDDYEGDFELEIIDIYQNPIIAQEGQIIAAPTLIKDLPPPVRRFIGDMSDVQKIIVGLDLKLKKDRDNEGMKELKN